MRSSACEIARRALLAIAFVVVSLRLQAGPALSERSPHRESTGTSGSAVPARPDDKTIAHVLNRIGFGTRPGDIEHIRAIGLAAYIDRQLRPERIADDGMADRLKPFTTLTLGARELAGEYFLPAMEARRAAKNRAEQSARSPEEIETQRRRRVPLEELSQQKILRAAFSERQLQEVMADFWFNHFNVFAGKGSTEVYLVDYERDAIRPHVVGKFRDLLHATATSPAMLFYLDNWQSAAADTRGVRRKRGLNEN
jgi:uncharacterized protein (DUF1800 family)